MGSAKVSARLVAVRGPMTQMRRMQAGGTRALSLSRASGVGFVLLSDFKIRAGAHTRIVAIVEQSAIDEDLFGMSIDRERIAIPQHHIGHFPVFKRAGLLQDAERVSRIAGHPGDRVRAR